MKNTLLFSSFLFFVSCAGTHKSQTSAPVETKKIIVEQGHAVNEEKTYTINSFSVEADVLTLNLTYKGGCGKHNFELYSNGLLMKSLPPQLDVILEHRQENETCTDEKKQTLKFDLAPIKKPGNPKVILNINSADTKAEWLVQ